MARRLLHSLNLGRPGTPVEVVLRLLVLKRLHSWSYEEVERFVGGSLVLWHFCRVGLLKKPACSDSLAQGDSAGATRCWAASHEASPSC
jgi:hypothetical protein